MQLACKTTLHEKAVTIHGLHAHVGVEDDGLPVITDSCDIDWWITIKHTTPPPAPDGIEEITATVDRVRLTCSYTSREELSGQTQAEKFALDTQEEPFDGFTIIADELETDTAGTMKITAVSFDFDARRIYVS